jgi:glycosyltransferase involved in cell wall biosynthesis
MQLVLPGRLMRLRPDVCHFTNGLAPMANPFPTVVTVHDLTVWRFPEHHFTRRLLVMKALLPIAVRRAAAVIAVSESTKNDIVDILGARADKVHVVHEGVAGSFRPLEKGQLDDLRSRLALPDRFVLHVGTIEPRKNLVRLLEAFAEVSRGLPHHLVLAGRRGWKYSDVDSSVERLGLTSVVHFLGYVPENDLVALYNLADALVYPSLYEGFGLPALEAMACGAPVIASDRGGLGEVVGAAAEHVDPESTASIAQALRRVLTDQERSAELRAEGFKRAGGFRWSRAAQETRTVYEQIIRAT